MKFLERDDIVYISRTFSDNLTPEQIQAFTPPERMGFIASSMRGYASKIISKKPLELSELPGYHDTGRAGENRYTCVVILHPEQINLAKKIQGYGGLTGYPEIDKKSTLLPLSEIKDNPVIITEFPTNLLDPHILLLHEGQEKRTVVYKGEDIDL